MSYEPRTYRRTVDPAGLVCFPVCIQQTDLLVCAQRDLRDKAEDLVVRARWELEEFIRSVPHFAETLSPMEVREDAPPLVRAMAEAGQVARVGPMAAVAGAIAEYVARGLAEDSPDVIVENGGDVYLMGKHERTLALWAGEQGVQGVGVRIPQELMPVAMCTSSGRIGHSLSLGSADAVAVLAHDGALSDAVATALANRVREPKDIERAIDAAQGIPGVLGVIATIDGALGAWGDIKLVSLEG